LFFGLPQQFQSLFGFNDSALDTDFPKFYMSAFLLLVWRFFSDFSGICPAWGIF